MDNVHQGLYDPLDYYDNCVDENEINDLLDDLINDIYIDNFNSDLYDKDNLDKESCINCYHSSKGYCLIKNIKINKHSPICWFYRDCLTMRTSSWYQDDIDEDD